MEKPDVPDGYVLCLGCHGTGAHITACGTTYNYWGHEKADGRDPKMNIKCIPCTAKEGKDVYHA